MSKAVSLVEKTPDEDVAVRCASLLTEMDVPALVQALGLLSPGRRRTIEAALGVWSEPRHRRTVEQTEATWSAVLCAVVDELMARS